MNSVIRGTSYVLVHAPDMIMRSGTTQTVEKAVNPDSQYLKEFPEHLRSYEQVVSYLPNQTYIGNMTPNELGAIAQPWYDKESDKTSRKGPFGEIMPEEEFYFLIQVSDAFDLVKLEKEFVLSHRGAFEANPIATADMIAKIKDGESLTEIEDYVNNQHADGLYYNDKLIGCVKRAHDLDVALTAHIIFENLVSKASSVLALRHLILSAKIDPLEVEYVIDCCEEACGDMNQRGGGNFAKAAAETAGFLNATGSDTRGFCAGPTHAIIEAAALVASGAYKNVVVTAGGCTSKLGMNGKEHVKKGMPILEDVLGGFSVLISQNDGISPEIDLSSLGRHTVGTGSSPQAVITALVTAPLEKIGKKISDIDKYSPEMQNPDITKPAGAGDVPLANYKMIGALAVKNGEIPKTDLAAFPEKHGMVGWAPTQGHIPSGVPYIGFARDSIMSGEIKNVMIIGKGSLFLGRMTNLFDGVSFIMQPNTKKEDVSNQISESKIKSMIAGAMKEFALSLMEKEG